jgi:hypothetical protein
MGKSCSVTCDRYYRYFQFGFNIFSLCGRHHCIYLIFPINSLILKHITNVVQFYYKTRLYHCQWLVTGRWFYPGPPVSSTNKNDRHDITDILLKVALNTIKQTSKQKFSTSLLNLLPHEKGRFHPELITQNQKFNIQNQECRIQNQGIISHFPFSVVDYIMRSLHIG